MPWSLFNSPLRIFLATFFCQGRISLTIIPKTILFRRCCASGSSERANDAGSTCISSIFFLHSSR